MKQSATSSWLLDTDRMRRAGLLLCSVALHVGIVMTWLDESKTPDAVNMGSFSAPVNLSFVSVAKPSPPPEPETSLRPEVVKAEVKPKPKIVKKAPVKVAKKVESKPLVKPKPQVRPKPKPEKTLVAQKPKPRPPVAQTIASSVAKASKQGLGEIPVITNPAFRRPPKPADYPRQAQRRNQQGTVLIEALVDEKGDVVSVKIVKSSGFSLLDRSATKAVRVWAFQPRMIGSRATKSKVQVPVLFELRG